MPSRDTRPLQRATFALAVGFAPAAFADNQSSTSFRVNGVVDSGGGRSTSETHVLTSCIGSEIAGSQSSQNFRIDSGCGATALAVVVPSGNGGSPYGTVGVPTLTDAGLAILVSILAVVAARRLSRRAG